MERHLPSEAGCFNFEGGDIRVAVEPIRTFSSCYFKTVPNRFKRFSGTALFVIVFMDKFTRSKVLTKSLFVSQAL